MQKPPTDDREAIEPHRKISGGYLRSKCGAQVCEANTEFLKAETQPREDRHNNLPFKAPN